MTRHTVGRAKGAIHLLIIGGSDAGISATLRAREVNPAADVTVVVADEHPNYSICGLPYYLSGEVPDWYDLAHRSADEIAPRAFVSCSTTPSKPSSPPKKTVAVVDARGDGQHLEWDRLIIAIGAMPALPSIKGLDLPPVFPLRTMADGRALQRYLSEQNPQSARSAPVAHPLHRRPPHRSAVGRSDRWSSRRRDLQANRRRRHRAIPPHAGRESE